MATDLLDLVTRGLGSDFSAKVSGLLGESAQGTQSALASGLPLLLAGLARKAGTPDGATDVLNLLNNFGTSDSQLSNIGGLLSGGGLGGLATAGSGILPALFGSNANAVVGALSNLAGVKPGSATTLLSAAAPLALGLLRRYTSKEGMGASGLASLLLGQRESLARQIPESLSRAAGFAPAGPAATPPPEKTASGFLRWLPWIVGAVVLLWLLSRCVGQPEVPPVQSVPAPAAMPEPAVSIPATATLYFETGSATPAADAGSVVAALADYVRADSSARVAVAGFHDPSGGAATNEELAQNRATAVRDLLVGLGVPESRIDLDRPLVTTGGGDDPASRRVEVSIR